MTLTTEEMQEIIIDETTGRDPKGGGSPEADKFRQRVRREIAEAEDKGQVVDAGWEWEV